MKTPAAPVPADPGRTAATQSSLNMDTAIAQGMMNNVNQVGPDGSSLNYTYNNQRQWIPEAYDDKGKAIAGTGLFRDIPVATATQNLSASGQRLLSLNNQSQEGLATIMRDRIGQTDGMLKDTFSMNGAPDRAKSVSIDDFSGNRKQIEDALYARIEPQMQRRRDITTGQLSNRGIKEGSEAFGDSMKGLDATEAEQRAAITDRGSQEQARLFGLAATQADRQNADRQNYMGERLQERNQFFNENASLMSGAQIENPNFVNTAQTNLAGVDYSGLVTNKDNILNNQYQQKIAAKNAMMGGLFGLAAAPFAMFSDRRLKRAIERIGSFANGLPAYLYAYVWEDGEPSHIGVMADDVKAARPDAVVRHPFGFDMVDYERSLA
jgi:hypothetical protein